MRILQIIDSLEIGGAEKMAVNYANALANKVSFSGLVATRKEGALKAQINKEVSYLFLDRKKTIDFAAIERLVSFCKHNKVTHLQPHSSSFFTALMVKLFLPKVKIIWHDHNGLSEFLAARKSLVLQLASFFFSGIIVVNYQLKKWAETKLNCKKVVYLANFTDFAQNEIAVTNLEGIKGKRILCLANLRFQKNHFLLLEVANLLKQSHPDWSFHLIGKDFEDDYSTKLKNKITEMQLHNHVFIYGSKSDTQNIIKNTDIAILTSQSEGLPVALLEYGLFNKPVIATNVGEIPFVIQNGVNGIVVENKNEQQFYDALALLINDPQLALNYGMALQQTIHKGYSEEAIMTQYLNWLQ